MTDQSLQVLGENRRIFGVLEHRPRLPAFFNLEPVSPKRHWFRSTLEWLSFTFAVPLSQPVPTLSRFGRIADATLLPEKSIQTGIHVHAYLLIMARNQAAVPLESIPPLVLQAWSSHQLDSIQACLLRAAQSSWREVEESTEFRRTNALSPHEIAKTLERIYREQCEPHLQSLLAQRVLRLPVEPSVGVQVKVLDVFEGFLERIDSEGIAHVTFKNREGKVAYAETQADDMISKGIRERDRFQCEIRADAGDTTLTILALPRYQLTEADYQRIRKELDEDMPDSILGDNDE